MQNVQTKKVYLYNDVVKKIFKQADPKTQRLLRAACKRYSLLYFNVCPPEIRLRDKKCKAFDAFSKKSKSQFFCKNSKITLKISPVRDNFEPLIELIKKNNVLKNNIVALDLAGHFDVPEEQLKTLINCMPNLQTLDMSHTKISAVSNLETTLGRLKILYLMHNHSMTDLALAAFINCAPNLEEVDISGTKISLENIQLPPQANVIK